MVEVLILLSSGSIRVKASGHALFDRKGQDLACCAISTLLQSYRNGVQELSPSESRIEQKTGIMTMEIRDPDATAVLLTRFLALNLKVLENEYPKNLNMTLEEDHGRRQHSEKRQRQ